MAHNGPGATPSEEEQHGWLFAGWGNADKITDLGHEPVEMHSLSAHEQHKLGQWRATAICGNDITSSVLYVSALSRIGSHSIGSQVQRLNPRPKTVSRQMPNRDSGRFGRLFRP